MAEEEEEEDEVQFDMDDPTIARLYAVFMSFDDDDSGEIDAEELEMVMKALGQACTDAELQDMVNEVDLDGNGTIEFDEFVAMMRPDLHPDMAAAAAEAGGSAEADLAEFTDEVVEAFKQFDPERTGVVSLAQLQDVVTNLGECLTEAEIALMLSASNSHGLVQVSVAGEQCIRYEPFAALLVSGQLQGSGENAIKGWAEGMDNEKVRDEISRAMRAETNGKGEV